MKKKLVSSPSITSSSRKPLVTSGGARFSVAVLGKSCVGKTALTVQYMTGRFIGNYCSGQNVTYRTCVPQFGGSFSTPVDILDTSNHAASAYYDTESGGFNEEPYWAAQHSLRMFNSSAGKTSSNCHQHQHRQAYLIVYSLVDATSFDLAKEILHILPSAAYKFLVANQLDLQHRRQVPKEEGQALGDRYNRCQFGEFSATDPHCSLHNISPIGKLIRKLISSSPQCVLAPFFPRISFSLFSSNC